MTQVNGHELPSQTVPPARDAARRIPSGVFVLTSAFENGRMGLQVTWVQMCGLEPLHVTVAVPKGHPISPMIRDSHAFALNQLSEENRFLDRKFERLVNFDPHDDPFVSMAVRTLTTGSPVIERAMCALDCEVRRHIDFDADHELYIAEVVDGLMMHEALTPSIRWGRLPAPLSQLRPTIGP